MGQGKAIHYLVGSNRPIHFPAIGTYMQWLFPELPLRGFSLSIWRREGLEAEEQDVSMLFSTNTKLKRAL